MFYKIPYAPRILGFAGLMPPIAILLACFFGPEEWRWSALAIGYGYAALIFSFLGGLWWGLTAAKPDAPSWIYVAAVMPSLIALVSYLPWIFGWTWPGPSMLLLGLLIMVSPLVDKKLGEFGIIPNWWMQLRWTLSAVLGFVTFILGCLALLPI